jgi:CubicO group peptidase (beta-lactamase class C family)
MHALFVAAMLLPAVWAPDEVPIAGRAVAGMEALDRVVLDFFQRTGSDAAQLAVGLEGRVIYSRAYGWEDREREVPAGENTHFGIASLEKAIAGIAIRLLEGRGLIDLDAPLAEFFAIEPEGGFGDPRFERITLRHVLQHRAGWGDDPVARLPESDRLPEQDWEEEAELLLGRLAAMPLLHDPGAHVDYSNFGYDVLRAALRVALEGHYITFYRTRLVPGAPLEFFSATHYEGPLPPSSMWNAAQGGPVWATARSLCTVMSHYWLSGEPREGGVGEVWQMNGSLPGSTALMYWRKDGHDIVVLFNGRHEDATHDELRDELNRALEDR